jgi:Phosphotransferase enzyme family
MDEQKAGDILKNHGFSIRRIHYIPEGSNHYVFDLTLDDESRRIVKFKKKSSLSAVTRDSLYGGIVSMEREAALYRLVREEAGLPSPEIFSSIAESSYAFLMVDHLPGKLWCTYMEDTGHSRKLFLSSMKRLGKDIARVQDVTFPGYGDVQGPHFVLPEAIRLFADRFRKVYEMRLDRCQRRNVLTPDQVKLVNQWFKKEFTVLKNEEISASPALKPVLVLTDMHGDNFLVDDKGNPTGYFDLESCQAAHPALEFYGLKFFLFNYYDASSFKDSVSAFFEGFHEAGGQYDPYDPFNKRWENLLAACRVLELAESYHDIHDGIRDEWSRRFKNLLFQVIQEGVVDYMEVGKIFREKNKQPRQFLEQ